MTAKPLKGRVALVTGASRGIGAAVAQSLGQAGAHVILLARTVKGLEKTDDAIQKAGGTATLLPFDLLQTEKIAAIAPVIAERFGRLDILVGNAAILGSLSPVAHSDAKMWQKVFKVNFFANLELVRALDPLLRASDAGRAVFVTSGAARSHTPYWSPYASSKAALESMAQAYAAEVAYSKLRVNIIDPGTTRTELRAEAFPGENPENLPLPDTIAQKFLDLVSPGCEDTGRVVEAA